MEKVISSLIKLMQNQVQYCASDHKRTYILNMINLIEKTESIHVLDLIIDSIRTWIIGNLNLNNKERWNLMLKLYSALKVRLPDSDELMATQIKYLDIVRVLNNMPIMQSDATQNPPPRYCDTKFLSR